VKHSGAVSRKIIGNGQVGDHIHTTTVGLNPKPVKVRLQRVSKTFSAGSGTVEALGIIDLEIREEEFLCIVGPSGCGKSTLLNLIAGLEAPETGEVWCNGNPVTGPGPDRVVIFQEPALFPWLTVLGNVEFGLRLRGEGKARRRERAMDALRMVHLHRFGDAFVHQLSGGMKQRVALARALVMNPEILLMDEPFAALDAQTRDLLHAELQAIWAETRKTIVFVTHNVREASCLGDRVVLLTARPGRIKREFCVDQPRPRQIEDPGTISLARMVLADLKDEVRKAFKEELGNGDER
jgi:NitT/TauT family transport system ATP-binding protein